MYGTLEQLDDRRWQLRFTRLLRHPVDTAWRAISEPEHLAQWSEVNTHYVENFGHEAAMIGPSERLER